MTKQTKKQIKEDAKAMRELNDWSRRVFGYTKNGYLYVNNKRVKKLERNINGDHIEDDDY